MRFSKHVAFDWNQMLHNSSSICFFLFSSLSPFQNYQNYCMVTSHYKPSAIRYLIFNGCLILIAIQGLREKYYQFKNFLSKKKKIFLKQNSWNHNAGKNTNYLPHFTRRQNQTKNLNLTVCIKILCYMHAILYKHCAMISQQFEYPGELYLKIFDKIVNMPLSSYELQA